MLQPVGICNPKEINMRICNPTPGDLLLKSITSSTNVFHPHYFRGLQILLFVVYPSLKAGFMQKVLCTKKLSPLPFSFCFSFSFCLSPSSRVVLLRSLMCLVREVFVCFLPQLESWGYAKILAHMKFLFVSRVVFCRASAPWDLQSQGN